MPPDRTAVISGVSSGIGRVVAARLLEDGWIVIGLSRRRPDLSARGFDWRHCDLALPESIEGAVGDIGTVQALIHAAGFQVSGRLGVLDPEDGRRMYAVHVDAAIRLANSLVDRITAD